ISSFDIHLASGSAVNGTWQGVVKIPRFSASGSWHIQSINLRDVVTNSVFLNSAQLQAVGINPILSVSSVLSDPTPPALTGLVFSPPLFNTSTGQQTVNITVSASDN